MVEYLKEVYSLNYHQIAILTNRDERNIWTIYSRACKKRQGMPYISPSFSSNIFFPLSVLSSGKSNSTSPLESVALYLKAKGLQNQQIASLLGRSQKTIWTVLNRAETKLVSTKHTQPNYSGGGNNE